MHAIHEAGRPSSTASETCALLGVAVLLPPCAAAAVVEREPIITGKPSPFLMSDITLKHDVTPGRTIMVGDRLDTDVLWGLNTGMCTLLVMTGQLLYLFMHS
jgi:ribonucleotide monophosphatase NagD (HAD superfamily)